MANLSHAPNTFGRVWQVMEDESVLFHTIEGSVQRPKACIMPESTYATKRRRRLGQSMLTEEDAVVASARVKEEDKDVCVVTDDEGVLGSC